jgi:hypothetical protein
MEKRSTLKTTYSAPKNVDLTQINFIDMPTKKQSEIALVNTINLK